jgi:protein NRD1
MLGNRIGDDDLRQLFEEFGLVQSCIVNQDKRHAFIKMLTREDAVKAKAGMETYRTENMTLRVIFSDICFMMSYMLTWR